MDNLFYFVLSFYDFIYMLFTVFIYTPRNIILQYATHARFIYWQVGLNRFKLHLQAYLLGWEITRRSTFLYSFFAFFFTFLFISLLLLRIRQRTVWRRCASQIWSIITAENIPRVLSQKLIITFQFWFILNNDFLYFSDKYLFSWFYLKIVKFVRH